MCETVLFLALFFGCLSEMQFHSINFAIMWKRDRIYIYMWKARKVTKKMSDNRTTTTRRMMFMYLTSALYTQKIHRIRSSSLSTSVLILFLLLLFLLLVGECMRLLLLDRDGECTSQCQTFVIEEKNESDVKKKNFSFRFKSLNR